MRTLKKVLALTVVLATVFSLTAFAAFTDADQINESCQDDINLMNALNVMVGDAEGTFRPNGTISRAEAAKMVYVVRNGGVDDKASGWTGMKVFSDVPSGAWYEGYVNYCASLGIIAGVGNNKFNPDGAVTGVELAKMMLVVAGYKPDVQGYTGANWSLNVINDAQQAYMFEGYALAFSSAAPRQWAAKLFSNAILKTQTAVYFNGELVNGLSAFGSASTIGQKYFSLQTLTGDLLSTYHASFNGGLQDNKAGTVNVSAINAIIRTTNNDGTVSTSYAPRSFAYDAPASLLGQEVTVVYKESGDKSSLDEKDTVYDVYATGTTNVVTTTRDAATIDGTTLKLAGVNGGRAVDYNDKQITAILKDDGYTAVATAKITSEGTAKTELEKIFPEKSSNENVTLILNNDNTIKYAFIENANYAFIKKIDLDKGQFTLKDLEKDIKLKDENNKDLVFGNTDAGKEKLADYVVVPSNLEEGNLVKYTVSGKTGNLVYTFEAMSPAASGAMTIRNSDAKATIGGISYSLGQAADELSFDAMPALNLDETFYVYTDGKYAVYVTNETGATSSKISSKMAYVIKASNNATDEWGAKVNRVQVLLADGTNKVYTYKNYESNAPTGYKTYNKDMAGNVYEYVISGDSIYFVEFSYTEADAQYNQDLSASKFSVKNQRFGAIPVDGNSYFFYAKDDEYKVVKAADLMDEAILDATNTATIKVNGIPTVAFGVATSLGANTGTSVYAFARSEKYSGVSDGKIVDMIDVTLSTGEEISAIIKEGTPVKGGIYKVTPSNDQYKFADPSKIAKEDLTVGTLEAASSTLVLVNVSKNGANVDATGQKAFNITADTQIFYVDEANKKLVDAFDLDTQAVKLSINSDNEVLAMYVTKGADPDEGDGKTAVSAVEVTVNDLTKGKLNEATLSVTEDTVEAGKTLAWTKDDVEVKDASTETYADTSKWTVTVGLTIKDTETHKWGDKVTVTVKGVSGVTATGTVDTTKNELTITIPKKGASAETYAFTVAKDLPNGLGEVAMADAGKTVGDVKMKYETVTEAKASKAGADALAGATFGYDVAGAAGNFTIKFVASDSAISGTWDNTKKVLTVNLSKGATNTTTGEFTTAELKVAIEGLTGLGTGAPDVSKITITGDLTAALDATAGGDADLGSVTLEGGKDGKVTVTVTTPDTKTATQEFATKDWTSEVSINAGGVTAKFNTAAGTPWDGTEKVVGSVAKVTE